MTALHTLAPAALWQQFEQICAIPHPSRHEEALIAHIQAFADLHGLSHQRDRAGNLILRKPASPGLEQAPGVVLQSHLDMVPQKAEHSSHNFLTDPIRCRVEAGWVLATDTTLGADNGIGVAAILAVLADPQLRHGPLEALLTVNEEAGMDGAMGLEPGILQGQLLLNLDSEEEGELYIGCAGGIDATATLPLQRSAQAAHPSNTLQITLSGLHGGHSGLDIHLGRGNANCLLAELVQPLVEQQRCTLISFEGGSLRNAIPRRSEVILGVESDLSELQAELQQRAAALQQQWAAAEPQLQLQISAGSIQEAPLTQASAQKLLQAILTCPNGVYRMDPALEGVVETSSNLARVILSEEQAEIQCLVRSARETARDEMCQAISATLQALGATITLAGAYPGWTPNPTSPLLATMNRLHQQQFGTLAEIKVIHAGLECGILATAYPHWDMISFGPTIRFPHSPSEKVEIASVERFWRYLCNALAHLAQ
ncbi:MAG TPA: aminoacyl-histidine dipeptidase [Motiliproteus sp.]